jgi:hypothetical protein
MYHKNVPFNCSLKSETAASCLSFDKSLEIIYMYNRIYDGLQILLRKLYQPMKILNNGYKLVELVKPEQWKKKLNSL